MTEATSSELLAFLAHGAKVEGHRPWPRYVLNRPLWFDLIARLEMADWALMGLWGEPGMLHVALFEDSSRELAVASLECPDGRFPSLSRVRPGAIRLERAVQDLVGLQAEYLHDPRPWLDHGQFPVGHPLAGGKAPPQRRPATEYSFLPVQGEGLHQIPVGPVHAGIIEPGHFRFTCNGETVARLEQRLGYVHKGVETLMQGKTIADAARLCGRVSGDSTVAYAIAFARAVEAALDVKVPARAHALRAVMAEMERIANHFGDVGMICNDAAFAFLYTQCGLLRERTLATAHDLFGHRLMMDRVVPGGVAVNLTAEGAHRLHDLVRDLRTSFAPLMEIYDDKLSLLDRTISTGVVSASLVHRFAAGGHVGRASARGFDSRRVPSYPPYDNLDFDIPVLSEGDVNARLKVRVHEIRASLSLIERLVSGLPETPVSVPVKPGPGEGMALVEAFRGDVLVWVRLDKEGRVARCHPRDASWFQWPLLEACIEGNIVADFPLCNKSFNCSYSGQDV